MNKFNQYFEKTNIKLELCRYSEVNSYWHESNVRSLRNCIYYIIDGEGEICINNNILYPKAGDLVFIPYGVTVSYKPISVNYYKKYWCHFQADYNVTPLFKLISVPYVTHVGENADDIISAFKAITDINETDDFASLDRNIAMGKLLSVALKRIGTENISYERDTPEDKFTAIDNYIEAHITERITVDDLAQLVFFHPNYFIKFFTKYYGTSPHKYITQKKIGYAKNLLIETDLTLEEIAETLKYNSAFHFSSGFKKNTGFSPSTYRNMNKKQ